MLRRIFGFEKKTTPRTLAATDSIAAFLASASLAPRQASKSPTLWPLTRPGALSKAPEYITLSDACARGVFSIDELRDGARVPHVLATNRGSVAVLVLFGEEIRGAKQNRIANASFLVPANTELVLDVSCVEHGRWSRRSGAKFASTGEVMSSEIRRKMAPRVSKARDAGRGYHADQSEVWGEIHERVLFAGARSSTGAYADYLKTRARDLQEMSAAFHTIPDQVGFVACVGEEVTGLEVIGRPEIFAKAFPGLLRGYLIDAIDHAVVRSRRIGFDIETRFDSPEAFLSALGGAEVRASASLGLGTDLRVEDGRVSAAALVEGEVVHLTAFPA
ncbi:MAG TPA: DUF6569 family protein [Myxococcota bacterium]|nr:DUF6569 family protein [Myxococcota bacterium]